MDTTEGGTLVEDNRSSGVEERQGSQPRMRGATQTFLSFPGVAQPLECPNFTGLGSFQAKKRLVDQVPCLRRLNFKYENWMQGNEARPFFLQHKKKLVVLRESRLMKKRQWHKLDGREQESPGQLEWSKTKPKEPIRHAWFETAHLALPLQRRHRRVVPLHHNPGNSAPCRNVQCNNH
ncbi:hypothetical protein R1flu_029311 [Riccia fluitans]|uniref:Uncharacterized protein n=1 Tax=Riccia fluitans TaxID=41844 RepID=A0ABD1XT84_9MARC